MPFRIFKFRIRRRRVRRKPRSKTKSHPHYLVHKEAALTLVTSRLTHYQAIYRDQFGYTLIYKKVTIKNMSSRWGSCSRKGNLNFNYRLALLPSELADYVIVHELCHLGEFNHSRKFWNLVEKAVPGWREGRAKLQQIASR
jgi:predicted metal-dependent hydrolase